MTRKEEIKEMARATAFHITSDKDMQVAFTDVLRRGAEWADSHPHWISVDEELPKDDVYVATINKFGLQEVRYYSQGKWYSNFGDECGSITHWMPLPEPTCSEKPNNCEKGGEE